MEEIWKDAQWYEWFYQVSNSGRVKSKYNWRWNTYRDRILNPSINHWYKQVSFSKKLLMQAFSIHRLVAIAFIPNPQNKPEVNHKDWNKLNNSISNLEWCTHLENIQHAWDNWLIIYNEDNHFKTNNPSKWKFWKDNHRAKSVNQFSKDWEFIKKWWSIEDASKCLKICRANIWSCSLWKIKSAGWFVWK